MTGIFQRILKDGWEPNVVLNNAAITGGDQYRVVLVQQLAGTAIVLWVQGRAIAAHIEHVAMPPCPQVLIQRLKSLESNG